MGKTRIVILGGSGTFGRLIAEQLAVAEAEVIVAGRDESKGRAVAESLHVGFVQCDARSSDSLRQAASGAYLVINAAGPFQARDYSIPRECLERGCHYIDLGDGREYVTGITELHEQARQKQVFVCTGASTTPAITSAAVEDLRPKLGPIRNIKVALSAGNKNQAGVSTIASILAYVGSPVWVWQDGTWQEHTGWGLAEFIDFPPPVGRRRVQLCDVPDLELFPALFDAQSVVFKAGVEVTMFNYAIAALGQLRRLKRNMHLPALARPLVVMSGLFKWLGTFRGSFGVWVTDDAGKELALAFVAPQNGPRVPASPAVLLARKLLAEGVPATGAFRCTGFLSLAEFAEHLTPFGITVVRGEDGEWITP